MFKAGDAVIINPNCFKPNYAFLHGAGNMKEDPRFRNPGIVVMYNTSNSIYVDWIHHKGYCLDSKELLYALIAVEDGGVTYK